MKLSVMGLSSYMQAHDNDLFLELTLPEGIDKDTAIDTIILKSGEFEVLYADPFFMQKVIGVWSRKHQRTFEKWINALNVEYNPLENYDRIEEWTDAGTASATSGGASHNSTTGSSEDKKSAYDSSVYENDRLNSVNNNSNSDFNNNSTANNNSEHKGRMHGNIGVTTSQQMLESELDIASWNIYEHIADLFVDEFCLQVY